MRAFYLNCPNSHDCEGAKNLNLTVMWRSPVRLRDVARQLENASAFRCNTLLLNLFGYSMVARFAGARRQAFAHSWHNG
jgi:hypothetical protein